MMQFTDNYPKNWKDLQDKVAILMYQAGYHTISPCKIETVRGTVEVDVFIESPDPLVGKIVCECKYWKTRVSQEKLHAFQTVVHNSGASLGLLISREGFQAGAYEAAKLSNVKLLTWEEFICLISDKWIINMLKKIKKDIIPLREYTNHLHFPYENLEKDDKNIYKKLCSKYVELISSCCFLSKKDLLDDDFINMRFYQGDKFNAIETYLNFLEQEVSSAVNEFEKIIKHSNIEISPERFDKNDIFTNVF